MNKDWKMDTIKHTHFDQDGKLQPGLNPLVRDGFLQVGEVEQQPSVTYKSCPDCARLKALLADVWKAYSPHANFSNEDYALQQRLKQEGIE